MRARSMGLLAWLALAGCGPERIATSGADETGGDETGDEALASAHWLLYSARTDDPSDTQIVSLRAVDLGGLEQGQIGASVELLEAMNPSIRLLGSTPWGGYALELDGAYMLVGLDEHGQIEVYPGVPEGVPAKAERPVFSADGRVAIFNGEMSLPPDSFYWVRYEHGHTRSKVARSRRRRAAWSTPAQRPNGDLLAGFGVRAAQPRARARRAGTPLGAERRSAVGHRAVRPAPVRPD